MANLETAHDHGALGQVDVVPAQITGFGNTQAVPIDHEPYEPVAVTVAVALQGREQLVHLLFGEVLVHPIGGVLLPALTGHITLENRRRGEERFVRPLLGFPMYLVTIYDRK